MFFDCRTGRGAKEREAGGWREGNNEEKRRVVEKEGSDLIPPKGTPL